MMKAQEGCIQPKWEKETKLSGKEFSLRSWVYSAFQSKKNSFEWNTGNSLTILPTAYCTSLQIAERICATGFHALSTLDGSFGKGVYLTTDVQHAIPNSSYCCVISHVLIGEVYPVIGTEVRSLRGAPLKRGYDCHYVITDNNGIAPTKTIVKFFDEIVIDQDAQIAPAFIIKVENELGQVVLDDVFVEDNYYLL